VVRPRPETRDFEAWYRAEHTRLVNSLYAVSGSVDAAREATDEAFARALERWSHVRSMDSPAAWTYRVALNVLRRSMRKRSREDDLIGAATAETFLADDQTDREVWKAVARLSPHQRQAVVLRYVADLTEREIAEAVGRNRGTVASDLSRARAALAEALKEPDPETRRA
jgi:RNA polymerase sigma-70 factor (ECF subfamily)